MHLIGIKQDIKRNPSIYPQTHTHTQRITHKHPTFFTISPFLVLFLSPSFLASPSFSSLLSDEPEVANACAVQLSLRSWSPPCGTWLSVLTHSRSTRAETHTRLRMHGQTRGTQAHTYTHTHAYAYMCTHGHVCTDTHNVLQGEQCVCLCMNITMCVRCV